MHHTGPQPLPPIDFHLNYKNRHFHRFNSVIQLHNLCPWTVKLYFCYSLPSKNHWAEASQSVWKRGWEAPELHFFMLKNGNTYSFLQHFWSTNKQFMNRNLGIREPLGKSFSYERWNSPMHQELEHLQDESICILKKDLLSYYFTHLSFPKERKKKGWFSVQTEITSMIPENQKTFQEVLKKNKTKKTPQKSTKNAHPDRDGWRESWTQNIFLLHNLCPYFMVILGCLNL